jgi:hypothetical protein
LLQVPIKTVLSQFIAYWKPSEPFEPICLTVAVKVVAIARRTVTLVIVKPNTVHGLACGFVGHLGVIACLVCARTESKFRSKRAF